jgi:hypothetical protein
MAVLSKATQKDPTTYATEAIWKMMQNDQLALASAIVATAEGFGEMAENSGQVEDSHVLVTSLVAMGAMVYEITKSQVEAKELEEMFAD